MGVEAVRMSRAGKWWDAQGVGVQLLVGGCAAIALWLLWAFVVVRWLAIALGKKADDISPETLGQVGDLFGGINALFAAFAFVGVAIAAYYQHRTFILQSEQSSRQAFEPLFFKLLEAHKPLQTLLLGWEPEQRWKLYSLSQCMEGMRERLGAAFEDNAERTSWDTARLGPVELEKRKVNDTLAKARRTYEPFYARNDGDLAPYFRKLYQVFKFIAQSTLSSREKVRYANIARASLNKDELLLLALNCATTRGADFKPLVEALGLLKHIPEARRDSETVEKELARHLYRPTATMGSEQREIWWGRFPSERPDWL
jgi:hypothetical protein